MRWVYYKVRTDIISGPYRTVFLREFLMTDARDGSSRTIRQFHFISWPEDTEVPRQADQFIDLIGQVTVVLTVVL